MINNNKNKYRPSVLRHLAVMIYDSLLLVSILLLASIPAVALNSGHAIPHNHPIFIIYLLTVSCCFYCWFWTHGGQTLGMRSWKIYIINNNRHSITWTQAFIRFFVAIISWIPLGMGYWWQYLGRNKLSWLDYFSATELYTAE
ncbi:MAG: RDD family protein [Piscirickettsiaceae bacterium]|nr:RDD family protein [Piscirickettsiaceae bacterium]